MQWEYEQVQRNRPHKPDELRFFRPVILIINMKPNYIPLLAISLIAIVFVSGCLQQTQKMKMDFSSTQLDYKPADLGIQEIDWLDNTTLQVKGYMLVNSAATIQNSSYAISGNKIKLIPIISYIRDPEKEETYLNPYELVYKFSNLERKNYEIVFDEGS